MGENAPSNEFSTKKELANRWRCSERTIDRLLEREGLPVVRLSARRVIFRDSETEQWLRHRGKLATGCEEKIAPPGDENPSPNKNSLLPARKRERKS